MEPKESLKEYEILDGTPTWAIPLFNKMKAEICAEVHAKVAYTVRIMLDQLGEEIKSSLNGVLSSSAANEATVANEICPCRDPRKCRSCIEKRAALRQAHRIQKQEEKMLSKMAYKESKMAYKESKKMRKNKFLKSSGTESDTDKQTVKQPTPCCSSRAPPVPPRKILPPDVVQAMTEGKPSASDQSVSLKITEDSPCELQGEPLQSGSNIYEPDGCVFDLSVQTKEEVPSIAPSPDRAEAQPCPSDSEFEVVSMPAVQTAGEFVRVLGDDSLLLSDDDNDDSSSISSNDSEAETTEVEKKITVKSAEYKGQSMMTETNQLADSNASKAGSLYPELELKKMTLSMVSSSTSTSTVLEYMSSCSTEDVGAGDQEAGAVGGLTFIERERTPYSIAPEVMEKMNDAEVVHSQQPLPSEFLRERNPYRQVLPAERKEQKPSARSPPPTTKEPQPSSSPPARPLPPRPTQAPQLPKPPQQPGDPKYRVDHLPESLWDEALTVAAQTYNAAKAAVENLADTFVPVAPGIERGIPVQTPVTSSPPPNQSTRDSSSSPSQQRPSGMTATEQKLYEMGFTNRTLNATLIARHKGDIEKIVAELIDP